jgi:hypothetical protein
LPTGSPSWEPKIFVGLADDPQSALTRSSA